MKENDILLGGFVAVHINDLDEAQMAQIEALLDEGDNDLYNWLSGKEQPPEAHDHDLLAWVKKFNNAL
ncbi:MAG: succinate dehydrogenase assembly factor 2 [Rhodospirillales bacterium]|nr:succinate dehydrogenase assembly factor 2 [Rhodospirillales bacterium]